MNNCGKTCKCKNCEMLSTESVKVIDHIDIHSENYHFEHYFKCLYTGDVAKTTLELKRG